MSKKPKNIEDKLIKGAGIHDVKTNFIKQISNIYYSSKPV